MKLQKLNLDKLKEKCLELELNPEGTKSQLIDRILEKELNRLKLAEYEEEWRETLEIRLLQEGC